MNLEIDPLDQHGRVMQIKANKDLVRAMRASLMKRAQSDEKNKASYQTMLSTLPSPDDANWGKIKNGCPWEKFKRSELMEKGFLELRKKRPSDTTAPTSETSRPRTNESAPGSVHACVIAPCGGANFAPVRKALAHIEATLPDGHPAQPMMTQYLLECMHEVTRKVNMFKQIERTSRMVFGGDEAVVHDLVPQVCFPPSPQLPAAVIYPSMARHDGDYRASGCLEDGSLASASRVSTFPTPAPQRQSAPAVARAAGLLTLSPGAQPCHQSLPADRLRQTRIQCHVPDDLPESLKPPRATCEVRAANVAANGVASCKLNHARSQSPGVVPGVVTIDCPTSPQRSDPKLSEKHKDSLVLEESKLFSGPE